MYLDARHDYCGVTDDLRAYWPKLRAGGVLSGDDFGHAVDEFRVCGNGTVAEGGVDRALAEFAQGQGLELLVHGAQWFLRKPP